MGEAAAREHDAALGDPLLGAVEVREDLALEDDEGLVGVRVDVQWRDLALHHLVLEHQEGAVGVLRADLPGVHAAPGEPATLTL